MARYVRGNAPAGLRSWRRAKPALSRVFRFECAYCETTEFACGSYRTFHVDHFRPKSKAGFRGLENEWSNLYYCCPDCNCMKGAFWPTPAQEALGYSMVDPCLEDPFDRDVRRSLNGEPEALTRRGRCMIEVLGFDLRVELRARWAWRAELVREMAEVEDAVRRAKKRAGPRSAADAHALETRLEKLERTYMLVFLGWDTRARSRRSVAAVR